MHYELSAQKYRYTVNHSKKLILLYVYNLKSPPPKKKTISACLTSYYQGQHVNYFFYFNFLKFETSKNFIFLYGQTMKKKLHAIFTNCTWIYRFFMSFNIIFKDYFLLNLSQYSYKWLIHFSLKYINCLAFCLVFLTFHSEIKTSSLNQWNNSNQRQIYFFYIYLLDFLKSIKSFWHTSVSDPYFHEIVLYS